MKRLLLHNRLCVRFLALYVLIALVFTLIWTLSYFLLPEGMLRGRTGATILGGSDVAGNFVQEWLRIAAINLLTGMVFIVGSNLYLSYNGYPLGYLVVIIQPAILGVVTGTNSFTVSLAEGKLVPSLEIFMHSGPYEIAAYVLAATATYSLSRYFMRRRAQDGKLEVVESKNNLHLVTEQWIGLALAVVLLLLANASEAYSIVTSFSSR